MINNTVIARPACDVNMAAVTSVADVISFASAIFPEEVIEIIKKSQFTMEDIHHLTRDDIDQEFKSCRFGIRKSLWLFFASFNLDNHDETDSIASSEKPASSRMLVVTASSESPVSQGKQQTTYTQTKRRGTQNEPCTSGQKNSEENEFLFDIVTDESDSNVVDVSGMPNALNASSSTSDDSYPGGIPSPFPLSAYAKTCLTQDAGSIKAGKSQLNIVVGEVLDTVRDALNRRPTTHDLWTVAKKLYEEYPAVESETTLRSEAYFYQLLRKKSNYRVSLERRITCSVSDTGKSGSAADEGPALALDDRMEMSTGTVEVSASEAGDEAGHAMPNVTGKKRGKYLQRFLQPPKHYLCNDDKEAYPGTVQTPFPLSDSCKKYLSISSRAALVNNRFAYLVMVREACGILYRNLGRAPTLQELRIVAKNLSIEYPVLQCDGKSNFENLYFALRKNVNNSVRRRSVAAGDVGNADGKAAMPVKKEKVTAVVTETKSQSQRYKPLQQWRGESKKTKGSQRRGTST